MKKVISLILTVCLIFSFAPTVMAEEAFTYDFLLELVKKINDTYISTHTWTPGYEWDTATYYIGCMDAYYLTGDEKYLAYVTKWAKQNSYKGHPSTNSSEWNNSNVFHADNETCFQVYIDLYNLDGRQDEKKIARVKEITSAQLATGKYDFWTWCDAIHMALPVYSKLYALTGDEAYLDFLYNSFVWSKSKMYDGEGGINYTGAPANLFFRDPGYIRSTVNGEKNIWARGVGWVMAAFARLFEDVPTTWEHYDEFKKTYLEMAQACINCAQRDANGRIFWTQSMLASYPTSAENPYGYETSGTGFITYSLYYGINSGLLDKETYLPYAEGGLKYLTEVATSPNGTVGYVQPIGSAATNATTSASTHNFGVGATLYALCEASRYYGGVRGDMYPYLARKTMGTVSFKINSAVAYNGVNVTAMDAPAILDASNRTLVPLRALSEAFGAKVIWNEDTQTAVTLKGDTIIQFILGSNTYYVDSAKHTTDTTPVILNGRTYVPLRAFAEAFGKSVFWDGEKQIVTIGCKETPFYACHMSLLDMLDEILSTGSLPVRLSLSEEVSENSPAPKLDSNKKIPFVTATASQTPEPENPASNAFDGDLSTRWAATGECEIVFDIGEIKHVEWVTTAFWKYNERVEQFKVLASTDGTNYKTYFNGASGEDNQYNYIQINDDARYIKLVGLGNSQNSWTSLLELSAYSK